MNLDTLKNWTKWVFGWAMVFLFVGLGMNLLPFGRDDTDADWPSRSGMTPMTDALTGCQYLRVPNGGVTPRLDVRGRHVGCRQ